MSVAHEALPVGQLQWTGRDARWFLIALHLPFIAFTTGMAATGLGLLPSTNGAVGLPLALAGGLLQLRHSLAASRGARPRYWQWTFAALLLLAYLPFPLFAERWGTMGWFVIASSAMLLPRRLAVGTIAAAMVVWGAWSVAASLEAEPDLAVAQLAWILAYPATALLMGGGSLFAAARLVRFIDELRDARAELAALAVGRERLRISRDLHDLIGRTLAVVALKGDLALRLLHRRDDDSAATEIASLTTIARSALHDIRDVTYDEHTVSLATEARGVASVLAAAGISASIDVQLVDPPRAIDELLGWALREGVTNVLRHSAAAACSIRVWGEQGRIHLEIENDGVASLPSNSGHGVSGIAARAAALGGSCVGLPTGDGRFRLLVDAPEVMA